MLGAIFHVNYFSEKIKNKQATLLTLCFIIVSRIICNISQFFFLFDFSLCYFLCFTPAESLKTREINFFFFAKMYICALLCSETNKIWKCYLRLCGVLWKIVLLFLRKARLSIWFPPDSKEATEKLLNLFE